MKRLLSFLVFTSLTSLAFSQNMTPVKTWGLDWPRGGFDSVCYLPTGCGAPSGIASLNSYGFAGLGQTLRKAAIMFDSCGHKWYGYDPTDSTWTALGSGGSGSAGSADSIRKIAVDTTGMGSGGGYMYYDIASGKYKFRAITLSDVLSALGYAPLAPTDTTGKWLGKLNNLNDVPNPATARTNLGLGTSAVKDIASSGDASSAQVVKGDDTRLTNSRFPNGSAGGDLTGTYPAPTITTNAVTNTKAAQMPANTIKGNNTGSTANASDLTAAQINTLIGNDTSRATIGGLLANKMTNFGGAPGQLQGTNAGIPAATGYATGTTYIAQDSGFQYVDTGSGGLRGWKKMAGGSGGSGGTPGLPAVTAQDSTTTTGIYAARLNGGAPQWVTDTIHIAGDSRTFPLGIPVFGPSNAWPVSLGLTLSKVIDNRGIGGTYISDTVGASSFYRNLSTLMPTATAHGKVIIWLYGHNDAALGASSQLFASTNRKCIDTAILNRGYLASNIYIVYCGDPGNSAVLVKAYHDSLATICAQKGVNFVDAYAFENRYIGTTALLYDGIHENVYGNNVIFQQVKSKFNSGYNVPDSAKSASVVGNIIDGSKIRMRTAASYPDTNAYDRQNLLWTAVDKYGNLVTLPNVVLPYSNATDSIGVPYNLNITGNIKGGEGMFTGAYFGSGQAVAKTGLYAGMLSTLNSAGFIVVDNGIGAGGKPLYISNNNQPVIINNTSFTPNADMLNVIGSADVSAKFNIGSNTHSASMLKVTSSFVTEVTDRSVGDVLSIPRLATQDFLSTINTVKPFVASNKISGQQYLSGTTGIRYTVAAGLVTLPPLGGTGLIIDNPFAVIDSGKVMITDTLTLRNAPQASFDTTHTKPLIKDDSGHVLTTYWANFVGTGSSPFSDATAIIKNSGDATKLLKISTVNVTTANTRTMTVPDFDFIPAAANHAQTWTGAQNMTGATVTVATPSGSSDAVPKSYIDGQATGGSYTPTLGTSTNVTAVALTDAMYSISGPAVHVMIRGTFTATSINTISNFTFTLPVTAASTSPAGGNANISMNGGAAGYAAGGTGLTSTTLGIIAFQVSNTSSTSFTLTLDYLK